MRNSSEKGVKKLWAHIVCIKRIYQRINVGKSGVSGIEGGEDRYADERRKEREKAETASGS
ncbi:hypothetical protein MJO28_013648 [Puccinia striiformis f. sp. tritici]|uniref:Uncharacterized protein n=1 Tax=Puccinia striiformis f. sp. tritici TaxID=168172 RepID=A0ACC0DV61_9BASI|nr:hypothetical protein MJO28_013648 [Puccinia striiformis f. sp. tritici]KAI7941414.1 hypothetical protein MJO29_013488 [Puccinia striiformis f. sp. tritici]